MVKASNSRRDFLRRGLGTTAVVYGLGLDSTRPDIAAGTAVQTSTVHADAIGRVVRDNYGFDVTRCEYFDGGVNHTYRLYISGVPHWFRVSRHARHPPGFVGGEVEMMSHLAQRGISVAQPIRDRGGRFVQFLDAPEGRREGVLFTDATGVELPGLMPDLGRKLGRALRELHTTANKRTPVARPRLDLDTLLLAPAEAVAPYLEQQPAVLEQIRMFARELHGYLSRLVDPDPRWGFCHGDLHFGNVFFDDGRNPTFIDFDHSINGHQAYDLAVHLWGIGPAQFFDPMGRAVRKRYWKAFVEGYEGTADKRSPFMRTVEAFIPTRLFEFLTFLTEHPQYFGVRSLEPRRIAGMFMFSALWARELKLPLESLRAIEPVAEARQPGALRLEYPVRMGA